MARGLSNGAGGGREPQAARTGRSGFDNVDTIVLDLDDTIVAGTPAVLAYIETIYEGLHRETRLSRADIAVGFQAIRKQEIYAFSHAFNAHGPLREKFPFGDLNQRFRHIGERAEQAFRDALQPDTGIMSAIADWKQQGYRVLLMTEGPGTATRHKVEGIGLARHLDGMIVVAENDPDADTPASRLFPSTLADRTLALPSGFKEHVGDIGKALAQFGVDPSRAVMIGNRVDRDLAPMQALGARTVLLDHFNHRPNEGALKKRLGELLFAGSKAHKGAGAATSDDSGGIVPDAVFRTTDGLVDLLPRRGTAPERQPGVEARSPAPGHSGPARPR